MKLFLKWSLFSLAFVPLLVNLETLFPFIFTKTLLIRTAITVFWILFAFWYFTNRGAAKRALEDNWRFFKNPVYIATAAFMLLMLISTAFAVNGYRAFFGDVERGEGFLGILHFFSFFIAALLVFDKEAWATFFRFNLISGALLLVDSIGEIASGEFIRAQSLVGNPTFLAGYFLFVIFSALIAFATSKNRIYWRIFSFLMIFGGIVGVFLTGTRGAILGLVAGSIMALLYFAVRGRETNISFLGIKTNAQKASSLLLILALVGLGVFVLTREAAVWQGIPGVRRFTTITFQDNTFQTRLISAGVSLDAINPSNSGYMRSLIGYGPDNFNIAYNKYYNPEYMRYESLWFDRAHNKILDVLVMNGTLGLLVYIGLWFYVFYIAFRKIPEVAYAVPVVFFGTAYFVQNLFVFDQISTWIPFFAFLGFTVYLSSDNKKDFSIGSKLNKLKTIFDRVVPYKLITAALFFSFALIMYTYLPYAQSVTFIRAIQTNPQEVIEKSESFSEPYTYMQATLRNRLASMTQSLIGDPQNTELVNLAVELQEEYVSREPYDPRDFSLLSNVYRLKGSLGEQGAYDKAIEYQLHALELAPLRQDHLHSLANLHADIGNYETMQVYAERLIESAPTVPANNVLYATVITREGSNRYAEALEHMNFAVQKENTRAGRGSERDTIRTAYDLYLDYFARIGDAENFAKALEGRRDFEIVVEERNEREFNNGTLDVLPPKQSHEFDAKLKRFQEGGFEALVN